MKSKAFILLSLLFAIIYVVSAAVTTQDEQKVDGAKETDQYISRCSSSCCAWGRFACLRCCSAEETEKPNSVDDEKYGGFSGGSYGGGGRGGGGGDEGQDKMANESNP